MAVKLCLQYISFKNVDIVHLAQKYFKVVQRILKNHGSKNMHDSKKKHDNKKKHNNKNDRDSKKLLAALMQESVLRQIQKEDIQHKKSIHLWRWKARHAKKH